MPEYMTFHKLAEKTGLTRQLIYRQAKKQGVEMIDVPLLTDGGMWDVKAVPVDWAEAFIARVKAAKVNTEAEVIKVSTQEEVTRAKRPKGAK